MLRPSTSSRSLLVLVALKQIKAFCGSSCDTKKESDVHKMLVKIPEAEKTRRHLVDGVLLLDEAHCAYSFCGHGYVDKLATSTLVLNNGSNYCKQACSACEGI
jgi:hypothetical protein